MQKVFIAVFFYITLIFLLAGCSSTPEEAFEKSKKTNSINAYQKFIEKFPSDPLTLKAKEKIEGLISNSIISSIRHIVKIDKTSNKSLMPWDEILINDKNNMFGLALKGMFEAQSGFTLSAIAYFNKAKNNAQDTELASQILMIVVENKYSSSLQYLYCPLPVIVMQNAVLIDTASKTIQKNQFPYLDNSDGNYLYFAGDANVLFWEIPSESGKNAFVKVMDRNISSLQ